MSDRDDSAAAVTHSFYDQGVTDGLPGGPQSLRDGPTDAPCGPCHDDGAASRVNIGLSSRRLPKRFVIGTRAVDRRLS